MSQNKIALKIVESVFRRGSKIFSSEEEIDDSVRERMARERGLPPYATYQDIINYDDAHRGKPEAR